MINELNKLGEKRIPFVFIIDFDKKDPLIFPIKNYNKNILNFSINKSKKYKTQINPELKIINKLSFNEYLEKYNIAKENFTNGNSWLINLTAKTEISLNCTLLDIYKNSSSKYKFWYNDQFTFSSPETFIQIKNNTISTNPMKGTILFQHRNSLNQLLNDEKELAEHLTIVDLLRNDLGRISKNVIVENFRYPELIKTKNYCIWQTSSKISGNLDKNWQNQIGHILNQLTPAGSVTGAPKKRTVEIIKNIENYDRDYYTGIAGIFTGDTLDSCVSIRFIEKTNNRYFYKSGGGVTIYSQPDSEYKELLDKIYVPD